MINDIALVLTERLDAQNEPEGEAYADALCSDYPDSDAAITHTYLLNDKEEN